MLHHTLALLGRVRRTAALGIRPGPADRSLLAADRTGRHRTPGAGHIDHRGAADHTDHHGAAAVVGSSGSLLVVDRTAPADMVGLTVVGTGIRHTPDCEGADHAGGRHSPGCGTVYHRTKEIGESRQSLGWRVAGMN